MKYWQIAVAFMLLALAVSPAYSSEAAEPAEGQAEATAQASDEAAADAETPAGIMDTPLDGSSVESFKAGLKAVDEKATENQYRAVMSALDYLLFYDLSARRSKEKLYAGLDGQTPNQIVQKVQDRRVDKQRDPSKRVSPEHGKRSAEKDL